MRVLNIFVLIFFVFVAEGVKSKYKFIPELKGYLTLQRIHADFYLARMKCHLEGGFLASPENEAFVSAMQQMRREHNLDDSTLLYTGISATVNAGDFTTVTGTDLSEIDTAWRRGEPDGINNKGACLTMNVAGELGDDTCDQALPYFCYKSSQNQRLSCNESEVNTLSVVNTVNTVSKSFNTALAFIINPTSAANPFQDKIKEKPNSSTRCESDETENGNGDEEHESGGEGSSQSPANVSRNRIASRARYSYQLDRFKKNAMLLFLQMISDPQNGCRNKNNMDAKKIEDTFNAFRFEVDVHKDLTCAEIDSKCQEFFQRDFRHYGAIMVVVMSFDGTNGKLAAYDGFFSESVILRHLTDDLNPTLLNKPKIYITETNRTGSLFFMGRRFQYSLPIQEHHRDVLLLHIPMLDYGAVRRGPISIICDNITKMADTKDFVTILEKSIEDAAREKSMFAADFLPISFSHSFSKEMMLYSQVPQ